jgi:pyruvate formate lyase activating enzyme
MKVNLGGLVYLSTVDWMGRASMVIFLRGCPLRCPHCQNKGLQDGENLREISYVVDILKRANSFAALSDQITLEESCQKAAEKPLISALVFSGGEPLMQPRQVATLARTAKSLRLKRGLETCGYFPERLASFIKQGLVDKVFLDIKASLCEPHYEKATGRLGVASRVEESLNLCMESGIPLEVRTTIFPDVPSFSEVFEIARVLSTLRVIYPHNKLEGLLIQQGLPSNSDVQPVHLERLKSLAESLKDFVNVSVKGNPKPIVELKCWSGEGQDE